MGHIYTQYLVCKIRLSWMAKTAALAVLNTSFPVSLVGAQVRGVVKKERLGARAREGINTM